MSEQKLVGRLTIGRRGCVVGEEDIVIEIEDDNLKFVKLTLSLDDMMRALTGLAMVRGEMVVSNLDKVGKVCISDTIEFPVGDGYRDKEKAIAELPKYVPEGWIGSTYFGSQSSFFQRDGQTWATTSIYKYVERDSEEGKAELARQEERRLKY